MAAIVMSSWVGLVWQVNTQWRCGIACVPARPLWLGGGVGAISARLTTCARPFWLKATTAEFFSLPPTQGCGGGARTLAKPLWAMMETAHGCLNAAAIAAHPRLQGMVMGTNDLAKEMRCLPGIDRAPLATALSLSVMAARAHGLVILDGVFTDIGDPDGLARQCAQGAAWGFDGKTLIHPDQIAAANQAFSPDPEEVAWAQIVAAAFKTAESAGKGVLRVEGRMVERLHLEQALRLLEIAGALEEA